MDAFTSDTIRVILTIGGAAIGILAIVLMFVLLDMAREAKEWFERENRAYHEEEVDA